MTHSKNSTAKLVSSRHSTGRSTEPNKEARAAPIVSAHTRETDDEVVSQILPTCHVCNVSVLDIDSLFHHMVHQHSSLTFDTCDICGEKYEDFLDIRRVMNHKELH